MGYLREGHDARAGGRLDSAKIGMEYLLVDRPMFLLLDELVNLTRRLFVPFCERRDGGAPVHALVFCQSTEFCIDLGGIKGLACSPGGRRRGWNHDRELSPWVRQVGQYL